MFLDTLDEGCGKAGAIPAIVCDRRLGTGPVPGRSRNQSIAEQSKVPVLVDAGHEAEQQAPIREVIELRQLYEMEDFPPSQPLEDFKKLDARAR